MMDGYDVEMIKSVSTAVRIPVVALGVPETRAIWPRRLSKVSQTASLLEVFLYTTAENGCIDQLRRP